MGRVRDVTSAHDVRSYIRLYALSSASVPPVVRSFLPRAYAPVKISISVEHSIVMAMCLSSYGRSSSAAPRFRLQRTRRNARAVEQMDRKVCLSFAPGKDSLAGERGGAVKRYLALAEFEKRKEFLFSLSHWDGGRQETKGMKKERGRER